MQLSGFKMENILKKLGAPHTFLLYCPPTNTDTFYQESDKTYREVSYWAVVLPARAYDLHSNLYVKQTRTGLEPLGIINIFMSKEDGDTIVVDQDYYKNSVGKYQIVGKEIYEPSYFLFEAHLVSTS